MKQENIEGLIKKWQGAGMISPEQANYMLQDVKTSSTELSGKKFVTVISLIGASVLTAGILLIIASNWSYLGKPLQLLLALLLPIVPLSIAYYMVEVKRSETILSRVANVFGVGLIGGSLAIIDQIYHLEATYTTLLLLWLILSLPFVFVFVRSENVGISATLGGLTIFAFIMEMLEDWFVNEQTAVVTITTLLLMYCVCLYTIGKALRNSPVWGKAVRILRLMSASIGSIVLFATTFEFYARAITNSGYRDSGWIPLSIALNLFFIGFLVFVLVQAIKYQEENLVYNTIRMMFLYVIVKYFLLFGKMLDTGLLFIIGGIIFIAGGWYLEKNKHKLMTLMGNTGVPISNNFQNPLPPQVS